MHHIITESGHHGVKFDLSTHLHFICSIKSSLNSIHFLVMNFDGWLVLSNKFVTFWYYTLLLYIYNFNNQSLIIICCCFTGGMYIFMGICVGDEDFLNPRKYTLKQPLQSYFNQIICCFCCFLDSSFCGSVQDINCWLFWCQEAFIYTYCSDFYCFSAKDKN